MSNKKEIFSFRLRKALEEKNISQHDLLEFTKVPQPTLSRWLSGISYPRRDGLEQLQLICEEFGLDYDHIIGLKDDPNKNLVPHYGVDVTATTIQMMDNLQEVDPEYLVALPKWVQADYTHRIRGYSMKGRFEKGEVLVCRRLTNWKNYFNSGEPYLIITRTDNMRTVKYVKYHREDDRLLWLIPHNIEQFDEQTIEKEEILFMYEVLGKYNDQI